ncbi:MAG TPA: cytochrome b/b6 domain-containing protein [Bryobacteraceae bacterium]|nr:cytochrome b/b6 domain-containing protein [Bryobacteraceae bacterium]
MGLVQWATSPWGQDVPIHIAWGLIYVAAVAGLLFLIVHAIYVRYFAKAEEYQGGGASPQIAASVPERVARHSLAARLFHWIMAAAMLALLITAFLPRVGVQFPWVTYHWIAGAVLTVSIIYHIIHASFWLDFWSIWPDKADVDDASRRIKRFMGQDAPPPRRFAKYPLENKLYHGVIVLTGLAVIVTGVFMMFRVRTVFFPRNPYLFGDMTWGLMYVLHGLAGVGLIALVMVHIYFAVRPEKFVLTKSMVFGSLPKEYYLEHHDPERWAVEASSGSSKGAKASA